MSYIIPRSQWGAIPAKSVTHRDPHDLKGVVVHWFGLPRQAHDHNGCPTLLKSVQYAHQHGEFNDIAYNHAVCPHGVVYECRGFGVQTGANGNREVNENYAAVVYMAGEHDPRPTPKALSQMAFVIRQWRLRGAGKVVRTHGSITGSDCPGPYLRAWVHRNGWKKRVPLREPRGKVKDALYRLKVRHGIPYTECVKP